MTAAEISLLLAGAVLAGFVQGVAGFGFALVAMSVWVWGLPPQTAAVMAVAGSLVGQVVAAFAVRRSLAWTAMAPMLAGGLAGIPLGVWLLPRLDPVLFKFCLGLLLGRRPLRDARCVGLKILEFVLGHSRDQRFD